MPEPTSTQTSPTTAEPPSPGSPHGWRFETKQVQAGHDPRSDSTRSRAIPIYQTTSYVFDSAEQAAARFALADLGPIYTRLNNPTNEIVENRIAALEGGAGALLTASGQAAQTLTFLTLGGAGSNIVASPSLYGGTTNLLAHSLPRLGIETRFVDDPADPQAWSSQADKRTIAFFGETIPNPRGDILDIEPVAAAAHAQGIPLVVDNTVASPFLTRPIEWGADIVVASATKFLGGHGSSVAGVIVDSGNFDFAAAPQRFPGFNTPDESYHGLVYARDLGVGSPLGANLAFVLKARTQGQRDLGFPLAPHSAFLIAQGIETLSLRMERHVDNALAVATWLEARDDVADVRYSGLASSPYYHLHRKYCPRGAGAVLAFDLPGGRQAGAAFIDALRLFSNLANIGDVRSLAVHPATTTHSQLDDAGLAASGIGAGTVRLSVGIEHIDDILADLERGLAAASGGQP
ncbi:O-acetylhomoserine aminocarboxypropyltransferase [Actinomyces sp. 2119]|uniref:O-acetylhomoserine aminocarboxypropyltransferase/cysteine synthase family protein n=1 Tax=Actinomyces sp. 2119 TaxID=2321393 RepID=UPI000E6D2FFB|nr:PLP-dependent transferase [Actinomyces sp. 2119]RJF41964.1 O-acetylhomoserine aminocarboxypropyltransferase [Actinomyces sp. 2119]